MGNGVYTFESICHVFVMLPSDGVYVWEPLVGGMHTTHILNHGFIVAYRVNMEKKCNTVYLYKLLTVVRVVMKVVYSSVPMMGKAVAPSAAPDMLIRVPLARLLLKCPVCLQSISCSMTASV
jgi:hypothetical protein